MSIGKNSLKRVQSARKEERTDHRRTEKGGKEAGNEQLSDRIGNACIPTVIKRVSKTKKHERFELSCFLFDSIIPNRFFCNADNAA